MKSGCAKYGCATGLIIFVIVIIASLAGDGSKTPAGSANSMSPVSESETVSESAQRTEVASAEPENKVHKEGDSVHIEYTTYAVWRSWWSDRLSDNQFLNQKPDAKYLFVELTVRNDDKKARTIPPFKLIDENGAEHETSSNAFAVEGAIGVLDDLNPGVSKQGFIIFDVPPQHQYRLKISGGFWSTEDALIELSPKPNRPS